MHKLKQAWSDLNSSLWFVPTLMVVAATLTAYLLVRVDQAITHEWLTDYPLLFGAGADGARGMLTAIASSMITVAGLIFSLTLSTLAQVANQYTSRLLRNFMRNRANQVVMGVFVSIFVYCLIVLRTIRGGDEGGFIPSLAVAFGLLLALISIGALIFFIHHIASSLQAANIVAGVAAETRKSMDRLFPKHLGQPADPGELAALRATNALQWQPIPSLDTGYVLGIDNEALLRFARDQNAVVRLERAIGSFVAAGTPLVSVAYYVTPTAPPPARPLHDCYTIGRQRTLEQDTAFGFRQLVDIGLKAVASGSDTSTALMCLDHLGALLGELATRNLEVPVRADHHKVWVITRQPDFARFVATAFDQLRANAQQNLAIYLRLFTALENAALRTTFAPYRQVLRQHGELTRQTARAHVTDEYDTQQLQERYERLQRVLTVS